MEIEKDLLSLVTPCYNGENHIGRLLNSVISQDYKYIEHFVIDDGSTDKTKEIVEQYIPLYEKKGSKLVYVYQENAGQSVALNNGLKLIKGEFFAWPDADDFYATSSAISELITTLSIQDESFSMVRSLLMYLDEERLEEVSRTAKRSEYKTDLFEDCLLQKNFFWYGAGAYLCKTKVLFEVLLNKSIYTEKRAGQNWQLMLPVLYKRKCVTVNKYLYNVIVRKDSHSRIGSSSLQHTLSKLQSYEQTILNTLDRMVDMPLSEKTDYKNKVVEDFIIQRINFDFDLHHIKEARRKYMEEKPKGLKLKMRYYTSYVPLGNYIYKGLIKLGMI